MDSERSACTTSVNPKTSPNVLRKNAVSLAALSNLNKRGKPAVIVQNAVSVTRELFHTLAHCPISTARVITRRYIPTGTKM